ncbi:MAG TPA: ABC transporter permease [Candidatus Microsaccharimonas sp.]|nr:ABC transporter permease [Candidatus Microsaccharimonas sp.]
MSEAVAVRQVRGAATLVSRFVAKRTVKIAAIWGYVFGATIASSAIGYLGVYKTLVDREKFAASFSSNVGINALIGAPHHLETINGFTAWRSMGIIILIGSIWAILTASKTFRGEEAAGRWEMLLVGQATAKQAVGQTLVGLGAGLFAIFFLVAACTYAAGFYHDVGFTLSNGLYMGLAAVCAPAIFLAFGALASQIQPTRARAAAMTAAFFGLSFFIRGLGNALSGAHWLVDISPLGWVEQLRPLTGSQPLWLLPIAAFILIVSAVAVHLAGARDLGESILPDRDSAPARLGLLHDVLPFSWRLTRLQLLPWLAGLLIFSTGFSSLTKTASDAIQVSGSAAQAIGRLSQAKHFGTTVFLGMVFLIVMTIMMLAVASALNAIREEEAEGYLDNLLVQPVSRLQWLGGRIFIVGMLIVMAGLLATLGSWVGSHLVGAGLSITEMLQAGINAMAPSIFLAGVGFFVLGFAPRQVSKLLYALVGWSFLIQMLGSIGNLNHWLLDSSLLHHIALAPTVSPKWSVVAWYVGLGITMTLVGVWRFNNRDLQNE